MILRLCFTREMWWRKREEIKVINYLCECYLLALVNRPYILGKVVHQPSVLGLCNSTAFQGIFPFANGAVRIHRSVSLSISHPSSRKLQASRV